MTSKFTVLLVAMGVVLTAGRLRAEEDSSEGLPPAYAKNYLVAKATVSRDEKFAVIYPTLDFSESKEAKDLFVALKPFKVLAPLPAQEPYSQNQSHGGVSADWSEDGNAALVTLDGKWGPRDVFLVELAAEKVKRITNLLDKARELVSPSFRATKPKPERYNDYYEFIFEEEEGGACAFEGKDLVKVYTKVTNDPKGDTKRPWRMLVDAKWDIAQAKFTSSKITKAKKGDD